MSHTVCPTHLESTILRVPFIRNDPLHFFGTERTVCSIHLERRIHADPSHWNGGYSVFRSFVLSNSLVLNSTVRIFHLQWIQF